MLPGDLPEAPVVAAHAAALPGQGGYAFHDPCVLGTRLNLVIDAATREAAYQAACAARVEIDRLDAVFNWRNPASEISRLNGSAELRISSDLFTVIAAAERWRVLSAVAIADGLGVW